MNFMKARSALCYILSAKKCVWPVADAQYILVELMNK